MDIGSLISGHARYRPDRTAIVNGDLRLSYAELNARVMALAGALMRAGVGKGSRVATVAGNCLEMVELFWASARIGAIFVPLSPLLSERTIAAMLDHAGVSLVLADCNTCDAVRAAAACPNRIVVGGSAPGFQTYEDFVRLREAVPEGAGNIDGDPLMIIYSSGTTGEPKGIVMTHYARAMYCTLYSSIWRMTPESVALHAGSLVFNGAYMTLLPSAYLAARFILMSTFVAGEVIDAIRREKVTHMIVVPTQLIALLAHPEFTAENVGSLEAVISMGAALPRRYKDEIGRRLPRRFYELYGLAEGFQTILDRDDVRRKPDSVGAPQAFFELRILDEQGNEAKPGDVGEIVGRGPIMMQGYYGRPDLTAKAIPDGWLRSGDMGYVDEEGYLYLTDRKKDMIKSGGVSIYPRDIEDVVNAHPAVREAVAFGLADDKWGESPVVAAVLDSHSVTAEELRAWINARVGAKFQRVTQVFLLDELPRNAAGKPLKRELRAKYEEAAR